MGSGCKIPYERRKSAIEILKQIVTSGSCIFAFCYVCKKALDFFAIWQITHTKNLSDNKAKSIAKIAKSDKLSKYAVR